MAQEISGNGSEAGLYGPYLATTTLDASGAGTVSVQAVGAKVQITSIRVFASSATNEAIATIYAKNYQVEGTLAGSSGDTTDTSFFLNDGEKLVVQWAGGDAGATATAVFSGWQSTPMRGFRAVH